MARLRAPVRPERGLWLLPLGGVRRRPGHPGLRLHRTRPWRRPAPARQGGRVKRSGRSYFERTLDGLVAGIDRTRAAERHAEDGGLLQRVDPRVKVGGLLALVVAAAFARNHLTLVGLLAVAVAGALLSRLPLGLLVGRVWLGTVLLTAAIALPALFLTPGSVVFRLPALGWPVTAQGLQGAAYLISRVETTATFSLLLVLSTPWTHVLKALRVLRLPVVLIVILGMTY
ncbi:MAG: hypothetical protein EHM24_06795, partial [Acidobacteria bacterium]